MALNGKLLEYAKKQGVRMDLIVRKSLIDVSSSVVMKTPVDSGRARGNWMPAIGSPNTSTTEVKDKSGAKVSGQVVSTTQNATGNVYYLTNSLPYIRKLEYGEYGTGPGATVKTTRDGFSVQAPNGMVRLSIKEFEDHIRRAIRSTD